MNSVPKRAAALASVLAVASALLMVGLAAGPAGEGWPAPDAVHPFILPGYAFAQAFQLLVVSLSPAGSIDDGEDGATELDGARGIDTFKIGGHTYAAVASSDDDGVQILNLTDPANVAGVGSIGDGEDGATKLAGAFGIATFEISGYTYAAVASSLDDAVQILNLTDPANVAGVGSIGDGSGAPELNGARGIDTFKIGGHTYAAVASFNDDGVQILNLTDPANVAGVGSIGDGSGAPELDGALGIDTFKIGGHTYAAVASSADSGVQILNLTDPSDISGVDSIGDGEDGATELNDARDIATFKIGGHTYAAVASSTDSGVQILNLTDPANVAGVGSIGDGSGAPELLGATGIATFQVGERTYAAVASFNDDGVQILDLTDPSDISGVYNIGDGSGAPELDGPHDIATFEIDGHTYAAVASFTDDGVQILQLTADPPPPPEHAFVTTWTTTAPGQTIRLPVSGSGIAIDWGDGQTSENVSGPADHEYAEDSTYTVAVTGRLTQIDLGSTSVTNQQRLASIEQWGNASWTSMEDAFEDADNMVYHATDAPDLSGVASTVNMFASASSFDGDISSWNVSAVTDMSGMFSFANSFDQPLNSWNVSSVTTMRSMFSGANSFDQPLNSWDVSAVTDMHNMFSLATSFDQPLNDWDVSSVTDMSSMFHDASDFDQPLNDWDVSSVTDMSSMFHDASDFDQPLNDWDVSSVTDMSSMFHDASDFDQPLASWDVSAVTDMADMFRLATSFDQPLNTWDVSAVTDMDRMFRGASDFDQPLASWDVSSVTDMDGVFFGASSFDQNLGNWYITPDSAEFDAAGSSLNVTEITAQNQPLRGHNPAYAIGSGGNSTLFEIVGDTLAFKTIPSLNRQYEVVVTATGSVFESGNNRRTILVDVSGATDNPPPVADAGPDQTVAGGDTVTLDGSGSTDTDTITYSWSQDSGTAVTLSGATTQRPTFTAPGGPATLVFTLTVTDTASQTDADTVTVTVFGPPVLTINGQSSLAVEAGSAFVDPGASCTDHNGDTLEVVTTGTVNTGAAGTYTITYSCADSVGQRTEATRTVRVLNPPPVLEIRGPASVSLLAGHPYEERGASCADYRGRSLGVDTTGTVNTASTGAYNVTYSCTDRDGRQSTATRTVTVTETVGSAPTVYSVYHRDSILRDTDASNYDSDAACRDTEDGDISHRVSASVTFSGDGRSATITYLCTDSDGNRATLSRSVSVSASTPVTVTDPRTGVDSPADEPVRVVIHGQTRVTVHVGSTYTDAGASCRPANAALTLETTIGVNTAVAGTYYVSYYCLDDTGRARNAGDNLRIVEVVERQVVDGKEVDVLDPVLSMPAHPTIYVGGSFTPPRATCTDARDGPITRIDIEASASSRPVDTSTPGSYRLHYTCTDSAGNYDIETLVVTVVERDRRPVLTAPSSWTIELGGTLEPSSFAACTDAEDDDRRLRITVHGEVDVNTAGTYAVYVRCTDSAGNTDAVEMTVTVRRP